MKKNNLWALGLITLISCNKNEGPQTLISKWESNSYSESVVERKLASSANASCLKDIFSIETLKAEITEQEKKFSGGSRVSGSWRHLDLSQLPIPQANFLKRYGQEIGDLANPDSIDYSMCEDLPCIYNRIYGSEDHVAGYVHYLWYLKFGHMLSADNHVFKQNSRTPGVFNGKSYPISAYLYNNLELYGLWRLTHMLKAPHTTLQTMKEIQRVPRGERFESPDYAKACGLAYSNGYILMTDGCLTIYKNEDLGHLYTAMAHELSHQIDYDEGRRVFKSTYRSEQDDYLKLSGMYLHEFRDEAGNQVREWKHHPGTKLVSSYAGTSAAENFAESIAIFRIDGETSKEKMDPIHLDFVSRDYYGRQYFDHEAIFKSWLIKYEADSSRAVFSSVIDCSKLEKSFNSSYFKTSDFSYPTLPGMLSCMGKHAENIADSLEIKAKVYEPDGCLTLVGVSKTDKWKPLVKKYLAQSFDRYLGELSKDKDYLARIQRFYDQLNDKTMARAAYINCFSEKDESGCYEQGLRRIVYDKLLTLNLPEVQTKDLAELYISHHPYTATQEDSQIYYQTFIAANEEFILDESQNLWQGCRDRTHDDRESPRGNLFLVGDGYMISSFYNCLNSQLPDSVKYVVRSLSVDGQKVEHAKEELLLFGKVLPLMTQNLSDSYLNEKNEELIKAPVATQNDNGQLRKKILSDFSWVTKVTDPYLIAGDCRKEAIKLIPFEALFHTKHELFSVFVEKNVCTSVERSKEFQNWLDNSEDLVTDQVLKNLDERLLQRVRDRAGYCLKKYPSDNLFNRLRHKLSRDRCLNDEWKNIEHEILMEALADPLVKKFQIPGHLMRSRLENQRDSLQARIKRDFSF